MSSLPNKTVKVQRKRNRLGKGQRDRLQKHSDNIAVFREEVCFPRLVPLPSVQPPPPDRSSLKTPELPPYSSLEPYERRQVPWRASASTAVESHHNDPIPKVCGYSKEANQWSVELIRQAARSIEGLTDLGGSCEKINSDTFEEYLYKLSAKINGQIERVNGYGLHQIEAESKALLYLCERHGVCMPAFFIWFMKYLRTPPNHESPVQPWFASQRRPPVQTAVAGEAVQHGTVPCSGCSSTK